MHRNTPSRPAGHIARRGENKYLIRIYLGRNKDTGQRHYWTKTVHGTLTEARKWVKVALNERAKYKNKEGADVDESLPTIPTTHA